MATSAAQTLYPQDGPGSLNWADQQYSRATDYWKDYAENQAGLSWEDFNDKGQGAQYGYVPGVRGYAGPGAEDTPFHDTETGIATIAGKGSYAAGTPSQTYTAQWGQPSRTYAPGTAPAGYAQASTGNAAQPQSAAATTTPTAGGTGGVAGGSGSGVTGTTAGAGVTTGTGSGVVNSTGGGAATSQNAPATQASTVDGGKGVTYLTQIDPSQLNGFGGSGTLSNGQQAVTVANGYYDEGGYHEGPSGSSSGIASFDPALGFPGGQEGLYDTSGKLDKVYDVPGFSTLDKVMDTVVEVGLAAAFGNVALGAMGGAGAGADSSLATQGDSINALDAHTGVGYGSEAGGSSYLTGPTSVNADYGLTSGTNGLQTTALDGNAGQGLNVGSDSGTGLNMPTTSNMDSMGGGQGLTTTSTQTLGDAGSFVNDPANLTPDASKTIVSENGVYSPSNPYQPSLGDPNSYINGGTGGIPATTSPGILDTIKGVVKDVSPMDVIKTISTIAPILSSVLGPKASGGTTPTYTPTQPVVGAGGYSDATAQGGASGSLAGVAGTLLTSKDTFGYGRSMVS